MLQRRGLTTEPRELLAFLGARGSLPSFSSMSSFCHRRDSNPESCKLQRPGLSSMSSFCHRRDSSPIILQIAEPGLVIDVIVLSSPGLRRDRACPLSQVSFSVLLGARGSVIVSVTDVVSVTAGFAGFRTVFRCASMSCYRRDSRHRRFLKWGQPPVAQRSPTVRVTPTQAIVIFQASLPTPRFKARPAPRLRSKSEAGSAASV